MVRFIGLGGVAIGFALIHTGAWPPLINPIDARLALSVAVRAHVPLRYQPDGEDDRPESARRLS